MNKFWKNIVKRGVSICLCVLMLAAMIPIIQLPTQALTSSSFISNAEHRKYIDMMMEYHLSTNQNLKTTLSNGKSVVFMFEGGSDNYPSNGYSESASNLRNQAVCIVVKQVNGSNQIVFYNEDSSTLPAQPSDTSGADSDRQTTLPDGVYTISTCNHKGKYGALHVNSTKGYYTPPSNPNGALAASYGINIHTRTSLASGAPDSAWSWGCMLIGYGNSTANPFNTFMKTVANINYNVWTTYSSNLSTITVGQDVGYFVVDRQLATGGMASIYNSTAISNITAASRQARAAAEASIGTYPTVNLTTVDDFSNETRTSGNTSYDWGYVRPNGSGDVLFTSGKTTFVVGNLLSTAVLADKNFANTTYFGIKLINKNPGPLHLNFEPVNGSGQTLYISSTLAASKPIWLKTAAGAYSEASVSTALSGTGRATVVIPQGFDGTVLIPKGVMSTARNGSSAADCSTLKSLGFFASGTGTGGVDYMLLQTFLADNVGSAKPMVPDVSFNTVDSFACETNVSGAAGADWGYGRPSGGDILISSGNQTLASVSEFGKSGLGNKDFSRTTYFGFNIQNKDSGQLFLDFEPVAAGGQTLYISSKLAAITPIWLRDASGNCSIAAVTEALSWSGRVLVAIPQGFNGTILIPKAVMATSWDATSTANFSQLSSLGFFMNGSGKNKDYILIKDFYANNLTHIAPNVTPSLVDHFGGETTVSGSTTYTYGYGRPDNGDILITSGSGGTPYASVGGFGSHVLPSVDLSGSTHFILDVTNLNTSTLYFNFEPRLSDSTALYISSKLALNFPVWLRDTSGNMKVASVTEAFTGTGRALVIIPQGFEGTIIIPKAVMSTAWNGTASASISKFSSLGFFMYGSGSGSNNIDYMRIHSFSANGITSNIPLTEVDSFANETASSGGLTEQYGYGRPSNGDILITSGSGGSSLVAVSGFGSQTLSNWDFSNVTYFALRITNKNPAQLLLNFEPRLIDGTPIYISSKLAVKNPILLVDAAGNTSEGTVSDGLSWSGRAVVTIPQGFDGTVLIPKAAMGTAWNATSPADCSRLSSLGFFMNGSGSGSNNVDYLLVRSFHTSGAPLPRFTVSFHANGGSGAPGSQTVTGGQNVTISSTVPTRTHYTFLGWSTSSTATTAQYAAGSSFTVNGNTTLYAVWKAIPVSLTYNANGGSGAPATQNGNSGQTFTVSSTVPTRTHYTFAGWATSASATSAQYTAGNTLTLTSNVTLYAVWTPIPVSLSYNANGGSGAPATQNGNSGQTFTVSSTVPTRTHYTFAGWATSASATSAQYTAGSTLTLTSNVTLYAVWAPIPVSLSYDANGGSGAPATQNGNSGQTFTVSSTVPTRTHYTFAGWAASASATSAQYAAGSTLTLTSNVTLYAVWTPIPVSLSYNANGGSGAPATQNGNSGQTFTVSSTKPTRTGYEFLGWASSAAATSAEYVAGNTVTLTANKVLYAVWTPIRVTLTYSANGGSGAPASTTVNYGQSVSVSAVKPTRTDYDFLGWASSASATTAEYTSGASLSLTSAKTLYAVWAQKVDAVSAYTVTLGDSIGVNFYTQLTDTTLSDDSAYMLFTLPDGDTSTVFVRDVKSQVYTYNGKACYLFSCGVAAKEMTDDIRAQLVTARGVAYETTYNVETYALYIISTPDTYTAEEVDLAKSLLNYGSTAQTMFDYKTDALANRALDEADKVIPSVAPATLESYTKYVSRAIDGVTYEGTSTVWKTDTIICHYFDITGENITFKLYRDDGTFIKDLDVQHNARGTYVAIDGIVAADMATTYRLVVSNGTSEQTINHGVYSYFYDILSDTTGRYSETEKTAIQATYAYSQAAIRYLESKQAQ